MNEKRIAEIICDVSKNSVDAAMNGYCHEDYADSQTLFDENKTVIYFNDGSKLIVDPIEFKSM